MKNLLNNPKFLNNLAISIAVAGLIGVGLVTLLHFLGQMNQPITITSLADSTVRVNGIINTVGLGYDQPFAVSNSASKLDWEQGSLIATSGSAGIITSDSLTLAQGSFYMHTNSSINLQLPNSSDNIQLNQFRGVVFPEQSTVVIMWGNVTAPSGTTYSPNQQIKFSGPEASSGEFNRAKLTSDSTWMQIGSDIKALGIDQPWVSDITAPKIVAITPDPSLEIESDQRSIELLITVDDSNTTITIGNTTARVDSTGKFATTLNLTPGSNPIDIILRDDFGNMSRENYIFELASDGTTSSPNQPTVNSSSLDSSCDSNLGYINSIVSAINNYRTQKSLPLVSLDSDLSQVSCVHSTWMDSTACDLESSNCHIGESGSTFAQRCQDLGVECQAESISSLTDSPESVINQLSTNIADSLNLQGKFTKVGVATSGKYITILFN